MIGKKYEYWSQSASTPPHIECVVSTKGTRNPHLPIKAVRQVLLPKAVEVPTDHHWQRAALQHTLMLNMTLVLLLLLQLLLRAVAGVLSGLNTTTGTWHPICQTFLLPLTKPSRTTACSIPTSTPATASFSLFFSTTPAVAPVAVSTGKATPTTSTAPAAATATASLSKQPLLLQLCLEINNSLTQQVGLSHLDVWLLGVVPEVAADSHEESAAAGALQEAQDGALGKAGHQTPEGT